MTCVVIFMFMFTNMHLTSRYIFMYFVSNCFNSENRQHTGISANNTEMSRGKLKKEK